MLKKNDSVRSSVVVAPEFGFRRIITKEIDPTFQDYGQENVKNENIIY